jgi:Zn-dependent peptidase ImmA (M78 family)
MLIIQAHEAAHYLMGHTKETDCTDELEHEVDLFAIELLKKHNYEKVIEFYKDFIGEKNETK